MSRRERYLKWSRRPMRWRMTVIFSAAVFVILVITMFIVSTVVYLLVQAGVLTWFAAGRPDFTFLAIVFCFTSVIVGTFVSIFVSRLPLRPVNEIIEGLNRLASGDFSTRMKLRRSPPLSQSVANSFNALARELENTEMLRSDFVNNFSHEFKTPIVSIRGFAKLLQKPSLSVNQRQEYLEIIAQECDRLADMATNILNLTKVENQSILTDVIGFNLSEQLRTCILLLEKRWTEKNLAINAEFSEYRIEGNEELLKQVWINLLDNAIKFSSPSSEVSVSISQRDGETTVIVGNKSDTLSQEQQRRVFDKFWQGDTSHASQGTGIGLSIVRQVVRLHRGSVAVESDGGKTWFTVHLPTT